MAELPQISGKQMGRVLARLGFYLHSQRGSHMKFLKEEGGTEIVIVPNHKILRKGTLHSILKQVNLSPEQLKKLL
jgi:predicted RNA binding protein YcfA (HicA-like mRNA interferase family)